MYAKAQEPINQDCIYMHTWNAMRLAMKSEASTDTVGLSEASQDSFQVMTVELALVPTRVMQGLSTTTFSLQRTVQTHVALEISLILSNKHKKNPEKD
jgi:hypothetical protein